MTVRTQRLRPLLTFDVPAGWTAHKARGVVELRHGRSKVLLIQYYPLYRETRDMTGNDVADTGRRIGPGLYGYPDAVSMAVPGGSSVILSGDRALTLAPKLHPRLGPDSPTPTSDPAAERLARNARARTMGAGRVQGAVSAQPYFRSPPFAMNYEWDLAAGYTHYTSAFDEVVRDRTGNYYRDDPPTCWGETVEASKDDTLEPRLEMSEQDIPPTTTRAWRVVYAPAEPQPDGSTVVRWTGFVSDGSAVIGADGLLRRVHVDDHGEAIGLRARWRTFEIAFTAFPAAITPVRPEPACPS
jgi:hypothetical protein